MKCINTTDAVGHVLCHDITRIVKDVTKDTLLWYYYRWMTILC